MNWDQLCAILWLRWRLTRNQFVRAGSLNTVVAIFITATMAIGALGLGVGGVIGGAFAALKASPEVLLLIWDGVVCAFFFVWATGLLVEIQRSESIDLTKLMHLPVTLQQVFVFNYTASHFTPSFILFLPAMLGLCAGLMLAGPFQALLFPVVLSFLFLVTAWTYWLRGWLAALMVNKRRRRTIIVWITILFVLVGQLPNLFFNSRFFRSRAASHSGRSAREPGGLRLPRAFLQAHLVVPPGWVGYSAMALKAKDPWPAVGAAAAGLLMGAFGLMRAYRVTMRFYQGAEGGEGRVVASPAIGAAELNRRLLLVERQLPLLPEDTAALTLATLRCLLRAPELKMALIMPAVLSIVVVSVNRGHANHALPSLLGIFLGTAAVMGASFSLAPSMANCFGFDRNGFRSLVLLPIRRHHILMAKNLAFFPFVAGIALLLLLMLKFLFRLPWGGVLAASLQVPLAFMLICLLCNLLSILTPYRVRPGSLQAKKPKPIVILGVFAAMLLTPVVMVPVLIPPGLQALCTFRGWLSWLPVNLLVTILLLVPASLVYWWLLPFQGDLLQRREQTILKEVTEETE
jgi:ABC-2 type transport system permease protein